MYIDNDQRKAKIGKVNVNAKDNSVRIRFTYPKGKRNEFNIAENTEDGWLRAIEVARRINRDIEAGCFDTTLASYSPVKAQALLVLEKPLNLLEVWENYKEFNKDRVAETTVKRAWTSMENVLKKSSFLELNEANSFVKEQLSYYSLSTLSMVWSNCLNPAVNFSIKQKKVKIENPYILPSPKQVESDIDCYEKDEIFAILKAIKHNTYNSPFSAFKHDYYWSYVYFQAITGARPENTCAITWDDVITKGDRTTIKFNKAYSKGVLLPYTKNKTIILFPVNEQLQDLLEWIKRNRNPKNKHNLVFCGVQGGYLNADNFNRNIWTKVVKALMEEEVLDRYLVPYTLRHSFITRLVREGVDVKTIAALSGNSVEVIINRYLKANKSVDVPKL